MSDVVKRTIRSFVRREGKMTPGQKRAMEQQWPQYGLSLDQGLITPPSKPLVLEIGFGMGTSLASMALDNPDYQFIGVEVYRPGVGALLRHAAKHSLTNLRVYRDDAVEVLKQCIPDHTLAAILIYFPDPWHKKRHHKRRLIQLPFAQHLQQKLLPEGYLHVATDWENYAEHIETVMQQSPDFVKLEDTSSCLKRPDTKYENRGLRLGHGVWDLFYSPVKG